MCIIDKKESITARKIPKTFPSRESRLYDNEKEKTESSNSNNMKEIMNISKLTASKRFRV